MAYCTEYEKLENDKQAEFLAKLIHAIQKDNYCFSHAEHIIILAAKKGIYKNVKFGRDALLSENQNTLTTETFSSGVAK